jgi:hypothetical protein
MNDQDLDNSGAAAAQDEGAAGLRAELDKLLAYERERDALRTKPICAPLPAAPPAAVAHRPAPQPAIVRPLAIPVSADPDDVVLAPIQDSGLLNQYHAPDIAEGEAPGFSPPRRAPICPDITEVLLNGLIAEMHFGIRRVALPSAVAARDDGARNLYLGCTMDLAKTGAEVGRSVALLRAAPGMAQARAGALVEAVARVVLPPVGK